MLVIDSIPVETNKRNILNYLILSACKVLLVVKILE